MIPQQRSSRNQPPRLLDDRNQSIAHKACVQTAGKKLGHLFRARKYFSPSNLLTLYKVQIRPSLEYCSHIWGAAAPTTLSILYAVQRRPIRLIGDPALTCHLQPLSHRRAVGSLRAKEDEITDVDILQLRERVRAIEECRVEFENLQAEIEENIDNESDLEKELNERESFENIYFLQISLAQKLVNDNDPSQGSQGPPSMAGPTIQQELLNILLRFRQHKYVVAADIAKMYRQALVQPNERPLQRILWRKNPVDELEVWQLNTMANENAELHPEICEIIKSDFYVDDLLTGADSIVEATNICKGVRDILNQGCFELRKFYSNDDEVLKSVVNDACDDKTHIQQLVQHIWSRWSKEYVSELQVRTKWKVNQHSLQKGVLVLIKDDQQPPLRWKLGRVEEIHPGKDGIPVRVLYYHLRHSYGIDETPVLPYAPGDIESVVENERCRIYWNYSFPTLELVQANKPDIFSAPAEVNIVSKEEEKRTKYQELLGQLLSALRAMPVCRATEHILAARMRKAVILGVLSTT
nr:unnamed protein product [Callosobruchus chinensis]